MTTDIWTTTNPMHAIPCHHGREYMRALGELQMIL